ncbi:MAG: gliding motility-associated C-terminal domain-containing protein [Chitinophagaceae bacterium]
MRLKPAFYKLFVLLFCSALCYPQRELFAQTFYPVLKQSKPDYSSFSASAKSVVVSKNSFLSNASEVIEKRTVNSRWFTDKDSVGKFYQVYSLGAINYNKNGKWHPIDEKIKSIGNGIYQATEQDEPVGFDVRKQHSFIQTKQGAIQFNHWQLFGIKAGKQILIASANWKNYTAGADGVFIKNIFPGIDAEMQVRRGAVKTNFIVKEFSFAGYDNLLFKDVFIKNSGKGNFVYSKQKEGVVEFIDNTGSSVRVDRGLLYNKTNPSTSWQYFNYNVHDNELTFSFAADFIKSQLASGPLIIDPLVSSTATLAQADITGSMNCGAPTKTCDYSLTVPLPANATFTKVSYKFGFNANAPSAQNQGHFIINTSQNCSGNNAVWSTSDPTNSGPGQVTTQGQFYDLSSFLLGCLPAPSCSVQNQTFILKFYNDYCSAGSGCSDTYVSAEEPLQIMVEGHTIEFNSINVSASTICAGDKVTLKALGSYGVPPYTYTWDNGAGNSDNVTVSPLVNTTYTVTITDKCSNITTGTTSIVVNPSPVIGAAANNGPLCQGSDLNLSIPAVTNATYSWSGPNGFSNSNQNPVITAATPAASGVYTVKATVNGCSSSSSTTVSVGAQVTPSVTIQSSSGQIVCIATPVTFTATPVNGGSTPIFQWKLNGTNVGTNSSAFTTSTLNQNDVISCDMISNAACPTPAQVTSNSITILKVNPKVTSTVDASICEGENYAGHTTSGTYTDVYTAANGCDSTRTLNLTVKLKSYSTLDASICEGDAFDGHTASGTYMDVFVAANGCDSIRTLNLTVKPKPTTTIDQTICEGETYLGYSATGIYKDTFLAVNGCDSVRTLNLTVTPHPHPFLGNDTTICSGDKLILNPGQFTTYQWHDGSVNNSFEVDQPGTYSVTVDNGCGTATSSIVVKNMPCVIQFPSAFTPNNDGKNDVFRIVNAYNLQEYHLTVYNRWGEIVFETKDYSKGWDGTVKGQLTPTAVFAWFCKYKRNNVVTEMKGIVTLIR